MLIKTELGDVSNIINTMLPGPELGRCLVEQYEEQISGLKRELVDVSHNIAMLGEDKTSLENRKFAISKMNFNTHPQIWRLLQAPAPAPLEEAIKLPKIYVPTFKGDIWKWRMFWEQVNDSVHSKSQLPDTVKMDLPPTHSQGWSS